MLKRFGEKKHTGGSEDPDGVDKKGPSIYRRYKHFSQLRGTFKFCILFGSKQGVKGHRDMALHYLLSHLLFVLYPQGKYFSTL